MGNKNNDYLTDNSEPNSPESIFFLSTFLIFYFLTLNFFFFSNFLENHGPPKRKERSQFRSMTVKLKNQNKIEPKHHEDSDVEDEHHKEELAKEKAEVKANLAG